MKQNQVKSLHPLCRINAASDGGDQVIGGGKLIRTCLTQRQFWLQQILKSSSDYQGEFSD